MDYESSVLTTFNTPIGRFRWLRLPFGVKSAPEIFQRVMDKFLEGIDGVRAVMDDILIATATMEEHKKVLRMVIAVWRPDPSHNPCEYFAFISNLPAAQTEDFC